MTKTNFAVSIENDEITLQFDDISAKLLKQNNLKFNLPEKNVFLLSKKSKIVKISNTTEKLPKLEFDTVILVKFDDENVTSDQFVQYLTNICNENGLKIELENPIKLPKAVEKQANSITKDLLMGLEAFGFALKKKKVATAKAQHRWKKALSEIEFHVDYEGAKATIFWQKSTEMRILAGAKILSDDLLPKRADGTLGFTAKFAQQLRTENADKIDTKTWTTTEDVILRSTNEVGHFLYFAGVNSWLHLVDKDDRTLHELSVV